MPDEGISLKELEDFRSHEMLLEDYLFEREVVSQIDIYRQRELLTSLNYNDKMEAWKSEFTRCLKDGRGVLASRSIRGCDIIPD